MAARTRRARLLAIGLVTVGCVAASWMLSRTRFLQVVELKTVDYRFRLLGRQDRADPNIVLADIDDHSIKLLEPAFGRWPWPREVHAYFLDFMRRAGARLVVYDVLFTERDLVNPESDARFVEATGSAGMVVHAIGLGDQELDQVAASGDPRLLEAVSVPADSSPFIEFVAADPPFPELAASAKALGHVANALDSDGPFRHYLLLAKHRGRALPSLALAAAITLQQVPLRDLRIGERTVSAGTLAAPLNQDWRLPIWFNGGPGTYRSYSYGQIVYSQLQIEEGEAPGLDPSEFRDRIVLVGVSGTGLHDMFTTPYSGTASDAAVEGGLQLGRMPGVEVHANVLDNLLHHRYLRELSPGWSWLIGAGITAGVVLAVFFWNLLPAVAGSLLLLAGYLWFSHLMFSAQLRVPVAPAVLCWSMALGLALAYQYWVEGAEKRKVKAIFSRYVSKDVYEQLLHNPEAARLGGNRMMVTVLFSDLRGFTSMSEHRAPEDIVALLNEYFSAMVEIVFAHRGTVDKFVGDMIMALFNAPLPDPDHADHAVQCALAMQKRLAELNQGWKERGMPQLACGVGINSGEMIAGNVGAETIRSYTVIGDNVNLGSRLESLCKQYQVSIIISEFTRRMLKGNYELVELDDVVVKGRSAPVKIFEVRGRPESGVGKQESGGSHSGRSAVS